MGKKENTKNVKTMQNNAKEVEEKIIIGKRGKLKCNYLQFKKERSKYNMHVPEKCIICGRRFEESDNIYIALDKKLQEIFICENCANTKE